MTDMREEFEKWFSDNGEFPRSIERDRNGEYKYIGTSTAWHVWQAARTGGEVVATTNIRSQPMTDREKPEDYEIIDDVICYKGEEISEQEVLDSLQNALRQAARTGGEVETLNEVCDILGIGINARTAATIKTNIANLKKFARLLERIEFEFFMVPLDPCEDYPHDEPETECLLNKFGSSEDEYMEQARAALSAHPAPVAKGPEGFALVPINPTERMLERGEDFLKHNDLTTQKGEVHGLYYVMLTAAPQPVGDGEVCSNCGTSLPEGCGGLFTSDGKFCLRNAQPQEGER